VTDSINGAAAMWDRMKFRRSGSFFFCAAGGLGFAVPGAVGAQLAQPERPVLAVSGDGSAQYGLQGLYTAASRHLPVQLKTRRDRSRYGRDVRQCDEGREVKVDSEVLVVGVGPDGLTLAAELEIA
jgi:glyoxylate carboligase